MYLDPSDAKVEEIRTKISRFKKLTCVEGDQLMLRIHDLTWELSRAHASIEYFDSKADLAQERVERILRLVESYQASPTRYLSPQEVADDVRASVRGPSGVIPLTAEQCDGLVSSAKLDKTMLDDARKRDESNDRVVDYITRQRDAGKAVDYWVVNDILESGLK